MSKNQDGAEVCLRDVGGKWVVLYFIQKTIRPVVLPRLANLRLILALDMDAVVLGVSADSVENIKFIFKHEIGVTLLSDLNMAS